MTTQLHSYVLLDRSGSMADCRERMVEALNGYLVKLKEDNIEGDVAIITFDSDSIDKYSSFKIQDFESLSNSVLVPRGGTPLFDAIAHVVSAAETANHPEDDRIAIAIITDGAENSSREITSREVVKSMLDKCEAKKWLVMFLGAGLEAANEGITFISAGKNLQFNKNSTSGTRATTAAMNRMVSAYYNTSASSLSTGAVADINFTAEEAVAALHKVDVNV